MLNYKRASTQSTSGEGRHAVCSYVTETENNTARKIDPAGVVSTLAGTGSMGLVS